MKKKPREKTSRATRRADERRVSQLTDDLEKLFRLAPGGEASRPIDVPSASVVEGHALSVPCPLCSNAHELVEHAAVKDGNVRLRETRLRCRQCGTRRSLFFRLVDAGPN